MEFSKLTGKITLTSTAPAVWFFPRRAFCSAHNLLHPFPALPGRSNVRLSSAQLARESQISGRTVN